MTAKETKKAIQKIGRAFEGLPKDARQYMIGYADGVIAEREKKKEAETVKE